METTEINLENTTIPHIWKWLFPRISQWAGKNIKHSKNLAIDGQDCRVVYLYAIQTIQPPNNDCLFVEYTTTINPEGRPSYGMFVQTGVIIRCFETTTGSVTISAEYVPIIEQYLLPLLNELSLAFRKIPRLKEEVFTNEYKISAVDLFYWLEIWLPKLIDIQKDFYISTPVDRTIDGITLSGIKIRGIISPIPSFIISGDLQMNFPQKERPDAIFKDLYQAIIQCLSIGEGKTEVIISSDWKSCSSLFDLVIKRMETTFEQIISVPTQATEKISFFDLEKANSSTDNKKPLGDDPNQKQTTSNDDAEINVINEPWRLSRPKKQSRDQTIWNMKKANSTWDEIADEASCGITTARENYLRMLALTHKND